ncbi:OX-2 membrane glycoprotein-like [Engystomops pustulosus]|uniref:OX-2 membrane glycoprotein-like n=1 Tax=Engystomops pustulosus TaxID=76066 RepID=UPI003AFAAE3C
MRLTMERTRMYIFLVGLLYVLCVVHGSDVRSEVGPVVYGGSLTLRCVLLTPYTPTQVTWTRVQGDRDTTVASYTPGSRAEVTKDYEDRLWISTSGLNETAITFYKTDIRDEGCYTCTFHSLTTGSKKLCFTIPAEVLVEQYHVVRLFHPVTLKCIKKTKSDVVQISWQHNGENVATYDKEEYIVPKYVGAMNVTKEVTKEDRDASSLTLFRVNVSDEGKYSCLFNSFPGGSTTGETTLQVYEPLNVTVLKDDMAGCLRVTCVARSWPRSMVSWLDVGEGSFNGSSYDGFLTVSSWILISNQKKMPKCKVIYRGEESLYTVSAGPRCRLRPVIIGLLLSTMFFL